MVNKKNTAGMSTKEKILPEKTARTVSKKQGKDADKEPTRKKARKEVEPIESTSGETLTSTSERTEEETEGESADESVGNENGPTVRYYHPISKVTSEKPSRDGMTIDKEAKINVQRALYHCLHYLANKFKVELIDTDGMAEVVSVLSNVHHVLRQNANKVGSLKDKVGDKCIIGDVEIATKQLMNGVTKIMGLYKLKYNKMKNNDAHNWFGTFNPLLAFHSAYKLRFSEVRTGMQEYTMSKNDDEVVKVRIDSFGLSRHHQVLCEGATFSPHIKSSMAKSMGPLVCCFQLYGKGDDTYLKKWENVFDEVYANFPHHVEARTLIKAGGATGCEVMKRLADLSLMGMTRQSNKFYPSPSLLFSVLIKTGDIKHIEEAKDEKPWTFKCDLLDKLDYSGKGFWMLWKTACEFDVSLKMNKTESMNSDMLSEIFVHATMGTHKMNLVLLEEMTRRKFMTREEIGKGFQNRNLKGTATEFKLIPFHVISKLSSAAQSNVMVSKSMIHGIKPFAGRSNELISNDLLDIINKFDREEKRGAIMSPTGVIESLVKMMGLVQERLEEKGNRWLSGTTSFYSMETLTYEDYGNSANEFINVAGERFFY